MDILRAVASGTKGRTRLMFSTNASRFYFNEYLKHLIEKHLLEELVNPRRAWNNLRYTVEITEKGEKCLKAFDCAMELLLK